MNLRFAYLLASLLAYYLERLLQLPLLVGSMPWAREVVRA